MSFSWFRKHQTLFLWIAVVFCVMVFALFTSFSGMKALVQGSGRADTIGRFTVATSGEVLHVSLPEFQRTRNAMNRYRQLSGGGEAVDDELVWQFLILRADAEGAGIVVSDSEVAARIQAWMGPMASKETYNRLWRDYLQFASARECERFFHDMMLGSRWVEFESAAARIVDADEVYTRWSADNMFFDLQAVVVPDTPPDEIPDPPRDELAAWFDEQPQAVRELRFAEPKRFDIVFAWLPLDAGPDQVSDEALAGTGELAESEIDSRFNLLKASRWPEAETMDEPMRAAVERELRIIHYVQRTRDAFDLVESGDEEGFRSQMEQAGLLVSQTDAPLDAEGLKTLDPIGDQALPLWLDQLDVGQTHFGYPYRDQATAYAVYVRGVVPSRPLGFDEGYDEILASWKEGKRNERALDWREAITERARKLPQVIEATQPILDAAAADLAAHLAEQPDLDEEGRAALREEIMAAADLDVDGRVAEYEYLEWDRMELPEGGVRLTLSGVPRGYGRKLDGDEAPDSIERFLKTNTSIYRLGVNAISQPLRHAVSGQTAIVRVMGTRLPSKDEMWADEPGMEQSRRLLASQRQVAAQQAFAPDAIEASHGLQLVVNDEQDAQPPPGAPATPAP